MLAPQKQQIIDLFNAALQPIIAGSELQPTVTLERPRDPSHGDVACNIAMQLAKPLKKNPRELAQALVDQCRGLQVAGGQATGDQQGALVSHPCLTTNVDFMR